MLWVSSLCLQAIFLHCCFFFFSSRRRHTRLQGDWSSDVCSSDLSSTVGLRAAFSSRLVWSRFLRTSGCSIVVSAAPLTSEASVWLTPLLCSTSRDRKSVV